MENTATKSEEKESSQKHLNQEIKQDGNPDQKQNVQATSEKGKHGLNSNTQLCAATLNCRLSMKILEFLRKFWR